MEHNLQDSLILSLANLFAGSQVDTHVVTQALDLLCQAGGFSQGLVYEADFTDQFLLQESVPQGACLRQQFSAKDLFFDGPLPHRPLIFLSCGASNSPQEQHLLRTFGAQRLALAPVVDDNHRAYGFVAFCGTNLPTPLAPPHQQALEAAFFMLVRYVSARMYRSRLTQARTALESVLDNTGIDIYVNDFYNHDILYVNKSMAAPYGGQSEFAGRKCWQVLFPGQDGPCEFCPQKKLVDETGAPTKVYSWDYQRPFDGSWFRVFSAAFRWVDGRLAHVVSSADITDNKRNQALVEYLANYDQLTNLPNRRMLVQECERRIDQAGVLKQGYLLFFDIDGFKSINDTLGHDSGDEFLVQLGQFFSSLPLLQGSIYRNGGDEFVALIDGTLATSDQITELAQTIHDRFKQPWHLKKGSVFSNTSIGVASYPNDGNTAEALLHKADMAMYQVKKAGGAGLCFSTPSK